MKKYDYYRPSASSLGRKKKVRKKYSLSSLKPLLLFLFFVALCFAGYVGLSKTYQSFSASRLGKWSPKSISVSGVDGDLAKQLQAAGKTKLEKTFSIADASAFEKELSQKYPQLQRVNITRGLWSGKLKIAAKRRQAVAKFVLPNGAVRFIDEDSTVYTDPNPDPLSQVPFVELEGNVPAKLGAEFVELVQSTLKLKDQLDFAFLRFNTDKDTVKMYLPDDSIINFGPAKNLRAKASRAAQIEELCAKRNMPVPHELDFTYFDDGKVFLRQTGH